MPRRLVTILEGESLVNDATAITCLRVATGCHRLAGVGRRGDVGFLVALVGGAAVGSWWTFIVVPIRRRITRPAFDTAISLIVPFAAYLPAENCSGRASTGRA
jgi:CPA1 family monovalent cation:H+ antiporter